ncbi:unnamed protein product, partial [Staurois parvus]
IRYRIVWLDSRHRVIWRWIVWLNSGHRVTRHDSGHWVPGIGSSGSTAGIWVTRHDSGHWVNQALDRLARQRAPGHQVLDRLDQQRALSQLA